MKLVDLIPLQEIEFSTQKAFDTYNKQHKLRPTTKVKIAGKETTAGQAAKVKGTSVFGDKTKVDTKKYDASGETDYFEEYDKLPDNIKDLMDRYLNDADDYDYKRLQNIQKEFEKEGWTFDFGLDAEPYELKPLKKSK
jgi:hypothetical protein